MSFLLCPLGTVVLLRPHRQQPSEREKEREEEGARTAGGKVVSVWSFGVHLQAYREKGRRWKGTNMGGMRAWNTTLLVVFLVVALWGELCVGEERVTAKRGETCGDEVACDDGLTCGALLGDVSAKRCLNFVGEGHFCNSGALSPELASHCLPGFTCSRSSAAGLLGASGRCTRDGAANTGDELAATTETPQDNAAPAAEVPLLAQGAACGGADVASSCSEGLVCYPRMNTANSVDAQDQRSYTVQPRCTKLVAEGEECNGTLPPAYATFCDEEAGFVCRQHTRNPASGLIGASGVCAKRDTPAKSASDAVVLGAKPKDDAAKTQTLLAQGAACGANVSNSNCAEGLSCYPRKGALDAQRGYTSQSRCVKLVAEGAECNGTLPPAHATFCDEEAGLVCGPRPGSTPGVFGASGVCAKRDNVAKDNTVVSAGQVLSAAAPVLTSQTKNTEPVKTMTTPAVVGTVSAAVPPPLVAETTSSHDSMYTIVTIAIVGVAVAGVATTVIFRRSFRQHFHRGRFSDLDMGEGYFYTAADYCDDYHNMDFDDGLALT